MNGIDIDGLKKGLTDTFVFKGVFAFDTGVQQLITELIHSQKDGAQFRTYQHAAIRISVYTLHVLYRDGISHIHLPGQQCRHTGCVV